MIRLSGPYLVSGMGDLAVGGVLYYQVLQRECATQWLDQRASLQSVQRFENGPA